MIVGRAVVDDIGVDAVKIGMLGSVVTIEAVGEALDLVGDAPVVLDPGDDLRERCPAPRGGRRRRSAQLVPPAAAVTPNVPEARVLARSGRRRARARPGDPHPRPACGGPRRPGHRDEASDLFFDGERLVEIPGRSYEDRAARGSGCTHSLAAHLARGLEPLEAAPRQRIASEAVRDGLQA